MGSKAEFRPDHLFRSFVQVDQDGSKEIEYEEFIYAFRISKSMLLHPDEQDTVDAWLALGGNVSRRDDSFRAISIEFNKYCDANAMHDEPGLIHVCLVTHHHEIERIGPLFIILFSLCFPSQHDQSGSVKVEKLIALLDVSAVLGLLWSLG